MSRAPLSVVGDAPPPPDSFREWMRAEAHRCLEQALEYNPTALLIIIEPKDDPDPYVFRVPDSQHMQDGMIRALAEGRLNDEQERSR